MSNITQRSNVNPKSTNQPTHDNRNGINSSTHKPSPNVSPSKFITSKMTTESSSGLQSVNILQKKSRLVNFAPELQLEIFSYCTPHNLSQLAGTCKAINKIVKPLLWSKLDMIMTNAPDYQDWRRGCLNEEQMDKMARATRLFNDSDLGYGSITKIMMFMGGEPERRNGKAATEGDLLELVKERIQDGRMPNVRYLRVELCREYLFQDGFPQLAGSPKSRAGRLIQALKTYSRSKAQSEFCLELSYTCSSIKDILPDFNYSNLTFLNLSFKNPIADSGGLKNYIEHSNQAYDIPALTKLLSAATNLRDLGLLPKPVTPRVEDEMLHQPQPASTKLLQALQTALFGLKKLRSLHVCDFLFDPSFFPAPPSNVKSVCYSCLERVSKSWWDQFAAYDFPSVETMVIHYQGETAGLPSRRNWWRGIDDGKTAAEDGGYDGLQHWKFKIHNVAISTLTEFICDEERCHLLPTDLVECIVRKNINIQKEWEEVLAKRYAENLSAECKGRLVSPLKDEVMQQIQNRLQDRFLDRFRDGQNGRNEEEEVRLFMTAYAKEMMHWIQENTNTNALGN
ncbi:hypothetical protein TWF225_001999 [Orbilia oligospora]|uniref:F-box domain-containing protein n=1 Tax=Orbilia oligospora TaxID=2813651 RepID=A0A8H2DNF1_ORBOL|nr:hypothetical protein TWF225_001999 [Orbilia oligospora]KAF3241281.1 hypothetical protein TWF217_000568 [Orbilia oligospora]KAF3255547.1 hypothetical protein TWF128_005548 [Orbilia oligospora]TGJ63817.1 hypothetical protein EYR41_011707 [Orbilia oligospora]